LRCATIRRAELRRMKFLFVGMVVFGGSASASLQYSSAGQGCGGKQEPLPDIVSDAAKIAIRP
jgi:hypothetical protein